MLAYPTFAIIYLVLWQMLYIMSRYRRADVPGGTYFFTVVAYRRRPILCDDFVRAALRDAIKTVQSRHPFTVDAWVHLHCLWTLPSGDADFSMRWGLIKRIVSLACNQQYHRADWMTTSKTKHRESTIWQRRFWEHQIRSDGDFERHTDYLHYNPVKHGLVKKVADWPYSSFHRYVKQGIYNRNWANAETNVIDGNFGEP